MTQPTRMQATKNRNWAMKLPLGLTVIFSCLTIAPVSADTGLAPRSAQDTPAASEPHEDYASKAQLQGIAKPKREAFLRFPTIGQISQIHIVEGARVQAGTALLTLDDSVQAAEVGAARVAAESKSAIVQAEVTVRRALRALERVKEAKAVEASSTFEVDAKQNDYDQALAILEQQRELYRSQQAQLELAVAKQSQMTLTAPFDGQVVLIAVKQGNTVDTTNAVVQIADLSLLEVEMHLPSNLYGKFQVGETMPLRAGVPVSREVQATIRYVSPVIEPTGGTFLVRFEIDNADGTLPAGFEIWFR